MPDEPYQPSPVDPHYHLRHLLPKVALLATWALTYFQSGGKLPHTPEGILGACAIVFLFLYDGGISIKGAGKIAPPK